MTGKINDDVFDYDSGMSQCISGFGRSTLDAVTDAIDNHAERNLVERAEDLERVRWHVGELVRWCRAMNGVLKANGLKA